MKENNIAYNLEWVITVTGFSLESDSLKIKFKIKNLVTWSMFKEYVDPKQIFNFVRPYAF